MEGDEAFYGGAKIRWQRLDRVEGSLDPIGQQQFADAGLMRAKLVAEAFGSRSSSETPEFGSGHFDAHGYERYSIPAPALRRARRRPTHAPCPGVDRHRPRSPAQTLGSPVVLPSLRPGGDRYIG
jgi:hypothetical protein